MQFYPFFNSFIFFNTRYIVFLYLLIHFSNLTYLHFLLGKFDDKENQIHAMASLRVLLEAQKANGSLGMKTMGGKGVPNSMSCPACSDCPDCTHGIHPSMVESPSGTHVVSSNMHLDGQKDMQMPHVETSPTSNVRVIWVRLNFITSFLFSISK